MNQIHCFQQDPEYNIITNKYTVVEGEQSFKNDNSVYSNTFNFCSNSYVTNKETIEYKFYEDELQQIYFNSQIHNNGNKIKDLIDIDFGYFLFNPNKRIFQIRPHLFFEILDENKNPIDNKYKNLNEIKLKVNTIYYIKLEYIDIANTGFLNDIDSFILIDKFEVLDLRMNLTKFYFERNKPVFIKIKSEMIGNSYVEVVSVQKLLIYPLNILLQFRQNLI